MNADAYKYIRFNASQETRWATVEEIKRSCSEVDLNAEDYPAAGIPIISDGKTAYVDNTDTHSLIFGATGSKKTRLFCMPMINIMAKAGESFIVTDPKGELYAQTSGLVKRKGYRTVVLNFRDIGTGDKWNPLTIPYELWQKGDRDGAGMLLSDIAATIAEPIVRNTKDSYWGEAAQELAIAGLYVMMEAAKKEEINMKSFAALSSFGNVKPIKRLAEMLEEDSIAGLNYKSTVCIEANVTVSGIVGTLYGMLRLFTVNDRLSAMLSETTFDMRRIGREKTAVYVIVPDEKTTYHFLVTMFLKQVYEILITEAQKEKNRQLPVRVNFVLDEFCNIPRIPDMPSMISAARSRNMRYYLVVQSMHQLKGRYGTDADTIKGNCDNWVFLTSKELALLNEISELCGSVVTPEGQQRRLISTSELQRFDKVKGEALIMHCRQYPIITEMADISQYAMFGLYDAVPLPVQSREAVPCFSLIELLNEIDRNERPAPFASLRHKVSQAKSILDEEMKAADAEPEEKSMSPFERFRAHRAEEEEEILGLDDEAAEERRRKKEEEKAHREAERQKRALVAREKAKERIIALLGADFADFFFSDAYDPSLYEDDDFGW